MDRPRRNLPKEVVMEILSRLSIKEILCCQCVCKDWLSLISDRDFVSLHMKRTAMDTQNHYLINPKIGYANEGLAFFNMEPKLIKTVSFTERSWSRLSVVGVCNGMICMRPARYFDPVCACILWNPAIRKYKVIERCKGYFKGHQQGFSIGFGLGVHGDGFICLLINTTSMSSGITAEVQLYSTRTDSYRKLEGDVPFRLMDWKPDVIMRGVPYWKAITDTMKWDYLVSFDVEREAFKQLRCPVEGRKRHKFMELNDSLAWVVCPVESNDYIDVWVLDNSDQWTKSFTIGPLSQNIGSLVYCFRNNDMLTVDVTGKWWIHYFSSKQSMYAPVNFQGASLHNYMESLVSVDGMKPTGRDIEELAARGTGLVEDQ